MAKKNKSIEISSLEKYSFKDKADYDVKFDKGLDENVVREISRLKKEPKWMLDFRLKALKIFQSKPLPKWGGDLSQIDFNEIIYYLKAKGKKEGNWKNVPAYIKKTFDKLGVPEAERKFLGGVEAQYDSETIYSNIRTDLSAQGIIFCGMDEAVQKYPQLVQEHFGKIVPMTDNKFAALNSAVWSGGSFLYIPKNVKIEIPLQAYFRINAENMGQFERTLIIIEAGARGHYVEGCTSPKYSPYSLHAAVVEVCVKKNAHFRYTTIQNWSNNIYNLVTKRAYAYENATVEWVDGNLGCLAGDSKIFTNAGVKEIKDVQPNDFVYSLTPEFEVTQQKVIAKKENSPLDVFEIKTSNHRNVKATANHPFLVLKKIGKLQKVSWMPLDEIKKGDFIAISGNLPDAEKPYSFPKIKKIGKQLVSFPIETNEEVMWLLGFYLGDGYTDKSRAYFAVPESDKSHEKVKTLIQKLFNINSQQKGVTLRINSVDLIKWLKEIGLGGTARQKRVPQWIYCLPHSQQQAFIEGYIAADGYMRKNHKNISITSANKPLLEDVKTLAMQCGLNPSKISSWTRTEKLPLGKEIKTYVTHFLYFSDGKISNPIYFVPVQSIQFIGKEITYDLEVGGYHNFIANGIFVHNSKLTMKYPSVYLLEDGARANIISIAFASKGQHQDAGTKVLHLAPNTTSTIVSKSISKNGGRTSYRGLLKVAKSAINSCSRVNCDALMMDAESRSDTYPTIDIQQPQSTIAHEAKVGKINDAQVFYLMSKGLSKEEALSMIVLGFFKPFLRELPMEYAVELNRLIEMEMEGSVG